MNNPSFDALCDAFMAGICRRDAAFEQLKRYKKYSYKAI